MSSTRTILLIDWVGSNWAPGGYTKHSCLEPYGLECVGAVAQQNGYQVKIFQPRHNSLSKVMDLVKSNKHYLVGLSVKTYNFARSLQLAKAIKVYNRKIYIVFGGEHPTLCPGVVREKDIDFVVRGEGELTFLKLLQSLDNNEDIGKINNIAFMNGNRLIITTQRRITKLDRLPFALRSKSLLKNCRQYGLSYPPPSQQKTVAQINYSRGCPYNCSFCASPQMWNQLVIYRSPERVAEEIITLKEKFGTNLIFFTDLTFNLNETKVKELCREIKKSGIKINWFCMCRLHAINKELLQLMKDAGCSKIAWGIESLNNNSLCKIKPNQQFKIDEIREILETSHSIGIINRAYLMLGYPGEKSKDIEQSFKLLQKLAIDELKVSFLTPFPGTSIYHKHRKSLLTEELDHFTTDEPIIKLNDIKPQELIEIRKRTVKEFYQSKEYRERMKIKVRKYPHLKQSYDEFFEYLASKEVF